MREIIRLHSKFGSAKIGLGEKFTKNNFSLDPNFVCTRGYRLVCEPDKNPALTPPLSHFKNNT